MTTDTTMASRYQPASMEEKWYTYWETHGYFAPHGDGAPYAIMIPPPNVTGTLHMGHAFQDTLMDILIRYQRMNGAKTLWQPGSDHAGIATQMVVERRLDSQGTSRQTLGRDAFTKAIWQWKDESGNTIMHQLRRLGASLDWSRERFTMDENMSRAVRKLFVRWYDAGLIYRGKRLVNWDPVLKTAISDIEVSNEEENGALYQVRYPFVAGQGLDGRFMEIATTRPETILADGALAVAPGDPRYAAFVGTKVHVPMTERLIPIIEDEYVDPEFGTGCVKITPAHDFNDYQVGKRHTMEIINLMNDDATLNDNAPPAYRGLSREAARDKIVADLDAAGLLVQITPHKLMLPRGDRSGVVIEPYLTDQWFVDLTRKTLKDGRQGGYERLTRPALEAVKSGRIRFVPQSWASTYFNWMENLEDWCISRQLWWGHRIPAWYDDNGTIYVAENEAEVRANYRLPDDLPLRQEEDVLDTWFSSGLWPFATLGWPNDSAALKSFYPGNVLVTGFDIIFFWVARMILMGLDCMDGEVPFREVYMHGLVRDGEGRKMSKSRGNVIDPIDVIDGIALEPLIAKRTQHMMQPQHAETIAAQTRREFPKGIPACGTDALRFTFAALATSGRDIVFDIQRAEGYRNFCNKLWNAARFALLQSKGKEIRKPQQSSDSADRWIEVMLDRTIAKVREALHSYRFDFAATAIYDFIWHDYCDWYLELIKPVLAQDNPNQSQKAETRWVMLDILERTLRMAHPFMPFITEEIWQQIRPLLELDGDSIMIRPYPHSAETKAQDAVAEIEWVQAVLVGVRKIRADMNIAPGKPVPLLLRNASATDGAILDAQHQRLQALGRLARIERIGAEAPEAAAFVVGNMQVLIPLAGLIDQATELARLDKEIGKLEKNITRLSAQLDNETFIAKAPQALVYKTRTQLDKDRNSRTTLAAQREKIAAL